MRPWHRLFVRPSTVESATFDIACVLRAFALVAVAVAVVVCPAAVDAQTGEDEIGVTLAPLYAATPDFSGPSRGAGGALQLGWGITDIFALFGGTAWSWHYAHTPAGAESVPAGPLGSAFIGASAALDVLTVVPFASGALVAHADPAGVLGDADRAIRAGARVGVGFDYRAAREWSFGLELQWHLLYPDVERLPGYTTVMLRVTRLFDLRALR